MTNKQDTFPWLYRAGDGNEGNYPRIVVLLTAEDDPYLALAVLVEDRYIPGSSTRRFIRKNIQFDGEPSFGVMATVYEGPEGEGAFGAAWITAQLDPLSPQDAQYYTSRHPSFKLRDAVDASAWRYYLREKSANMKKAAKRAAAASQT